MSTDSQRSIWVELFLVFWEEKWRLLGFVAIMGAIHFAVEYVDVLFPDRKPVTLGDACLLLVFGGMVFWGHWRDVGKRIEKLEDTVRDLQRKLQ